MSDPIQKPIDQKDQEQIPAGGTPAEAPKPKEPSHEGILTGFKSQTAARKVLSEKIAKDASKKVAEMEVRKNNIASAAAIARESALKGLEQEKAEKEAFLQNSRQEDLDRFRTAAEAAKKDLEEHKEYVSDFAGSMNTINETKSKADAVREMEHEADMKAVQEESAAHLAETEKNYLANMSIIKAIEDEIAKVKSDKEVKLKELWSFKLDEKVADEVVAEQPKAANQVVAEQPAAVERAVKKVVVSPGVKGAAIATAALLTLYFGLKHNSGVPTHQSAPQLSISSDSVKSFVPIASTGLAGLATPESKSTKSVVPVTAKVYTAPGQAKTMKVAAASKKDAKVAPKAVKKEVKKAVEKKGAKRAAEKKEVKKAVDAGKAYTRFTNAIATAVREIKTFNSSGSLFQKSPKESLKAFYTYAVNNASKLSTEQHAAIAELLFVIRDAKKIGALSSDEWKVTKLNGIRKGGMNVDEIKKFTNDVRKAIKEKKAHLAMDKKGKKARTVKVPVAKQMKKAALVVKPVAPKAAKGVKAEPLMRGTTIQKTATQ